MINARAMVEDEGSAVVDDNRGPSRHANPFDANVTVPSVLVKCIVVKLRIVPGALIEDEDLASVHDSTRPDRHACLLNLLVRGPAAAA